jgi:hypothetical protein
MTDSSTREGFPSDLRVIRAQLLTSTEMHLANSRLQMEAAQTSLSATKLKIARSLEVIARSECLERELRRLIHF